MTRRSDKPIFLRKPQTFISVALKVFFPHELLITYKGGVEKGVRIPFAFVPLGWQLHGPRALPSGHHWDLEWEAQWRGNSHDDGG
jgi:hypothetical protein